MANSLGYYNPLFYAQEALIQLENTMGITARFHRGYDAERKSFGKGDTIRISRPSVFTVQDAPSTAQDLNPGTLEMTLNFWKEVKFKLTDKELAFTTEKMISDHIRPAAYAIANDMDARACALYKDVPWFVDIGATAGVSDITGVWKQLFDNKVPTYDHANMHWMLDSDMTADLVGTTAFAQFQGAGPAGVETQRTGTLGQKYGFEFFTNQNVQSHTKGTCNDTALQVGPGAVLAGVSAIPMDAVDGGVTGTLVVGDTFVIAGNTQRYAVTAIATAAANAFASVAFVPPLVQNHADNDAITVSLDNHLATLAFHRNAFALATAPLSEMGNNLGANIASITDERTGLSIRARLYYVGNSSEVHVALDVLYGLKTLDPNLACRGRN